MYEHEHVDTPGVRPSPVPREMRSSGTGVASGPASVLHLQRAAGNAAVGAALEEQSPVTSIVGRGGGSPLDPVMRLDMEQHLGADFSDVRVHTDSAASASAAAVNAHAYTVGNDVVFGDGAYTPGSDAGRKTLAHELTHVVQQRSGPVDGTPAAGGIKVSDPSDRFEQEASRTAERVASIKLPSGAAQMQREVGTDAAAEGEADVEDEGRDLPTAEVEGTA